LKNGSFDAHAIPFRKTTSSLLNRQVRGKFAPNSDHSNILERSSAMLARTPKYTAVHQNTLSSVLKVETLTLPLSPWGFIPHLRGFGFF